MSIVDSVKSRLPWGKVIIRTDDKKLVKMSTMDPQLMVAALAKLKKATLIDVAFYPNDEGEHAMLFRDSEHHDKAMWIAVCNVILEE